MTEFGRSGGTAKTCAPDSRLIVSIVPLFAPVFLLWPSPLCLGHFWQCASRAAEDVSVLTYVATAIIVSIVPLFAPVFLLIVSIVCLPAPLF